MAKMQRGAKEKITGIRRKIKFMLIQRSLKMLKCNGRFVPVPVGMKQVFLQGIYSECTLNTVRTVVGELQLLI
jgi:hypothetical protein